MMAPDTTVKLKVLRNGEQRTMSVTTGRTATRQDRASVDQGNPAECAGRRLGGEPEARCRPPVEPSAEHLGRSGYRSGPLQPGGRCGTAAGDVIQEVNRKPVRNKAEFEAAVRNAGKTPLLLVDRGGNTLFVAV